MNTARVAQLLRELAEALEADADVFLPPPLPPKGSEERRRLVQALARWVLAGERVSAEQAKESEAA